MLSWHAISLTAARSGAMAGDLVLFLFASWVLALGAAHPLVLLYGLVLAAFSAVNFGLVVLTWLGRTRPRLAPWPLVGHGLGVLVLALYLFAALDGRWGGGPRPGALMALLLVMGLNAWAIERTLTWRDGSRHRTIEWR